MDSLRWEPKQRVGLQCISDCWYLVGRIFEDVDSVDVSSLMLMEEDSLLENCCFCFGCALFV